MRCTFCESTSFEELHGHYVCTVCGIQSSEAIVTITEDLQEPEFGEDGGRPRVQIRGLTLGERRTRSWTTYEEGIQTILRAQCEILVSDFGFPPQFTSLVGKLWFHFLATPDALHRREGGSKKRITKASLQKQKDLEKMKQDYLKENHLILIKDTPAPLPPRSALQRHTPVKRLSKVAALRLRKRRLPVTLEEADKLRIQSLPAGGPPSSSSSSSSSISASSSSDSSSSSSPSSPTRDRSPSRRLRSSLDPSSTSSSSNSPSSSSSDSSSYSSSGESRRTSKSRATASTTAKQDRKVSFADLLSDSDSGSNSDSSSSSSSSNSSFSSTSDVAMGLDESSQDRRRRQRSSSSSSSSSSNSSSSAHSSSSSSSSHSSHPSLPSLSQASKENDESKQQWKAVKSSDLPEFALPKVRGDRHTSLLREKETLHLTLELIYIATLYLRIPILPNDLINWAAEGKLPYWNGYRALPPTMVALRFTRPTSLPSPYKLLNKALELAKSLKLEKPIPPVNTVPLLSRIATLLEVPASVERAAQRLLRMDVLFRDKVMDRFGMVGEVTAFVYLASLVLMALKILFRFDDSYALSPIALGLDDIDAKSLPEWLVEQFSKDRQRNVKTPWCLKDMPSLASDGIDDWVDHIKFYSEEYSSIKRTDIMEIRSMFDRHGAPTSSTLNANRSDASTQPLPQDFFQDRKEIEERLKQRRPTRVLYHSFPPDPIGQSYFSMTYLIHWASERLECSIHTLEKTLYAVERSILKPNILVSKRAKKVFLH